LPDKASVPLSFFPTGVVFLDLFVIFILFRFILHFHFVLSSHGNSKNMINFLREFFFAASHRGIISQSYAVFDLISNRSELLKGCSACTNRCAAKYLCY